MRAPSWLAVVAFALLAGACPKRATGPAAPTTAAPTIIAPTPSAPFDAMDLAPADAVAVARLDGTRILEHPLLREDRGIVEAARRWTSVTGVEPSLLHDAAVFYEPCPRKTCGWRAAIVVPSSYEASPALGDRPVDSMHAGHAIRRSGRRAHLAFLPRATIIGDATTTAAILDVHDGLRPAMKPRSRLRALLRRLPEGVFRLAAYWGAFAESFLPGRPTEIGARAIAGSVALGERDVVLTVLVDAVDPPAFVTWAQHMRDRLRAEFERKLYLRLFRPLLNKIEIELHEGLPRIRTTAPILLVASMLAPMLRAFGI